LWLINCAYTGIFGLVLNLMVLAVVTICEVFQYRHNENIFVANLAAIDAAVSLLLMLTVKYEYDPTTQVSAKPDLQTKLLCQLWYSQPALWGLLTSSAYGIVALALDTYLSVVYQPWYLMAFTKRKVRSDSYLCRVNYYSPSSL
jgi:7 transmembrane receptor (rhodopsin family)